MHIPQLCRRMRCLETSYTSKSSWHLMILAVCSTASRGPDSGSADASFSASCSMLQ